MAEKDIVQVDRQDGKVSKARRFDERDWKKIADWGVGEYERRKKDRKDREKYWKEIDRQVAMEPEISFKKLPNGQIDQKKAWMAETELPLQAQALEVLTADARRMLFPDNGPWCRAHAEMTDEYLDKVDLKSLVHGDKAQVPSEINQDNCDKLAEGFLMHLFRQYDHVGRFDRINAEAFKYGMGVARTRMETKNVYINEARGVRREKQKVPVIVPCSIKNVYLDDSKPSMHSSQVLGPVHIAHEWIKFENLAIAANKGSTDPNSDSGGWMPNQLKKIEPDKTGYVQLIELEGDIIVPRKTVRSVVIPGAIITIGVGGSEGTQQTRAVIRCRYRKYPFSSYLEFPYHYEGADDKYPSSPLMKGRTVQMLATDACNRLLDAAMLKNAPPVGYDPTSPYFAQTGGPEIYPYAQWQTIDACKVYNEVGGDPAALASIMSQAINLYAELTGVLPARLGAQSRSHTTAYAKDAEIQRGATRTVDYVNATGNGPITRWLDIAYRMGRDALGKNEDISFFIQAYGGYVNLTRDQLPENVNWEWFGSGGPQERQAQSANKLNALQMAIKMDQLAVQYGMKPTVNIQAAIRETLREGGWQDLDAISMIPTSQPQPNPGAAVAALQNMAQQ